MNICDHEIFSVIKNIISFFITPIIALMAFCVAYTQREIAANKYNLDLFFKKFELFSEYSKFFDDHIMKHSHEERLDISKIYEQKNIFSKLDRLYFSGNYEPVRNADYLITDTYREYKNDHPKGASPEDLNQLDSQIETLTLEKLDYEIGSDERNKIEFTINRKKESRDIISEKINNYMNEKNNKLSQILSLTNAIKGRLDLALYVPPEPFVPYREKIRSLRRRIEDWIIEREKIRL